MERTLADIDNEQEFIDYIEANKERVKDFVNLRLYPLRDGYSYTCLLHKAMYFAENKALEYIMREFWDVLDPNAGRKHEGERSSCLYIGGEFMRHWKYSQLIKLSEHPNFDITPLLHEYNNWGIVCQRAIEEIDLIIANAKPLKKGEFSLDCHPILREYVENPHKVRNAMRIKHYGHLGAKVFCFVLLINNKLLKCYSKSSMIYMESNLLHV